VTTTVESPGGLVLRRLGKSTVRAGAASVHWDGRDRRGHLVYGGRYVVRVRAVNGFGASELKQAFRARRA
jgi:flagellar hook assembly protein FlgD